MPSIPESNGNSRILKRRADDIPGRHHSDNLGRALRSHALVQGAKGNLEVELLAETELDRLLNRKAVVYSNLKDLDFEHRMGRLGEADFHRLEGGFKAEAAEILHKLDKLGAEQNLDEGIEKAIAERKAKLASGDRGSPRAGA